MLEGDEITLKTIEDEQIELRKKLADDVDEELEDDIKIERASDDEDDEYYIKKGGSASKPNRKSKRVVDEDLNEEELEESESDD